MSSSCPLCGGTSGFHFQRRVLYKLEGKWGCPTDGPGVEVASATGKAICIDCSMPVEVTVAEGGSLKRKPSAKTIHGIDARLYRILDKFAKGEVPRCSHAQYNELRSIHGIGNLLQLESAYGADRRGGMVLTNLHPESNAHDLVRRYLDTLADAN